MPPNKTGSQALASLRWWGIDEDSTLKWGLLRLVKGLGSLPLTVSSSASQLASSPAVARCRQSGGWMARSDCTPRTFFLPFDANLDFIYMEKTFDPP
jgi:hypothetical protein